MAKKILVVDDEAPVIEFLRETLEAENYEVDSATDGSGALSMVRQNIYDAAILDFNLPDTDGIMLHRQIRQMDGELAGKTLFMSGLDPSEQNLGYYSAFGSGFLPKPFGVKDVLDALARLWAADEQGTQGRD